MDFSSFNTFDPRSIRGFDPNALRKLTINDVRSFVLERKMEVSAVILLLVGLGVAISLNIHFSDRLTLKNQQLLELLDKEEPLAKYKKSLEFKEALLEELSPGLDATDFIPNITELAKKYGVRITGMAPPESLTEKYYVQTRTELSFNVSGFQNMMLFLNELENSAFSLLIEGWSIAVQWEPSNGNQFSISLAISSIDVQEPDDTDK